MAGLGPAIHDFGGCSKKDVDGRHKAGHDERAGSVARLSRTQHVVQALPQGIRHRSDGILTTVPCYARGAGSGIA